ncbi:hypothetical protein GCM10009544_18400 [Streptomyces stramineus]|uniref:Secreted protein n=1 Tax=Streptomyces stramineus TaxID=173861 RepID=A0ABN0ZR62_9ACTN
MPRVRRVVTTTVASALLALASIMLATPAQAADGSDADPVSEIQRSVSGILESGSKLLDSLAKVAGS